MCSGVHAVLCCRCAVSAGAAADLLAFKFDGYGNTFDMRLEPTTAPFAPDFRLDVVDERGKVETVSVVDLNFVYRGRLVGEGTEGSDVRAQITDKGLTATVTVQGELFVIEPIGKTNYSHGPVRGDHEGRYNHLITSHNFAEKHPLEHAQCGAKDQAHGGDTGHGYTKQANTHMGDDEQDTARHRRQDTKSVLDFKTQNTCKMSLVADQHFFKNEGASSTQETMFMLVRILEDVNSIYSHGVLPTVALPPVPPPPPPPHTHARARHRVPRPPREMVCSQRSPAA